MGFCHRNPLTSFRNILYLRNCRLPSEDKQRGIQQKFIESFNLRKRAKDLLECAKRAVETAIEQNERTAIDWLESVSQGTDA
ncbi:MAG: hypothetical protein OXG97_09070 [Candidatus Poribacteria bacterium]|nr:hypothetical protein [Candidatus Poribacteria bacterium]